VAKQSMLYLLCGKMASGKSTLSQKLSQEMGALLISEDGLLATLYPAEITDMPTYLTFSNRLKSAIEPIVVDFLLLKGSIVLDFPANTVSQRAWLLGLATKANASHELHYISASDSTCKARLQKRALEAPERAATDTVEMFDAISKYFEPPSAIEGLNVVWVDGRAV